MSKPRISGKLTLILAGLALAGGGLGWKLLHKAAPAISAPSASANGPATAAAAPDSRSATAGSGDPGKTQAAVRPALTVTLIRPEPRQLPLRLEATGSVAAWDEASLGADVSGLRLAEMLADVGDSVKKGQLLARFAEDTPAADLAQAKAGLAEAEAALSEASQNADRARKVGTSGALSAQQVAQYLAAEKTAQARRDAATAQVNSARLRLDHCRVVASDDGVISARSATLGAVAAPGQELFRLIRRNRLEWRAEIPAASLPDLRPGLPVDLSLPGLPSISGQIRMIAPTVSPQTRTGLVYVDLPNAASKGVRPGMFGRGQIRQGDTQALTLPMEAIALRDGFSLAFIVPPGVKTGQARVTQTRLQTGRQLDGVVEILSGLEATDMVVSQGAAFLNDGDLVRVVSP